MHEKEFLKCVIYNRNSNVYTCMWYMVASWACGVTLILSQETSAVLLCVGISVTSQAQLATITSSYFCCR